MDQRNDVIEFQIAKPVITNGAGCFSGESAVPECAIQSVTDLNLHFAVDFMVKKTAIASERATRSHNHDEL